MNRKRKRERIAIEPVLALARKVVAAEIQRNRAQDNLTEIQEKVSVLQSRLALERIALGKAIDEWMAEEREKGRS